MSAPSGQSNPRRAAPAGTVRLGSVAGVDITVATSWFLVVGLLAVLMAPRIELVAPTLGALSYVAGAAYAVLFYLSVLLHEIAHALAARAFQMPVRSINLHFLGGATEIEVEAATPWREFVIAVVGPLTSLAVGVVAFLAKDTFDPGVIHLTVTTLAFANLVVGALNLVPGLPLDGGRVLQAIVWALSRNRSLGVVVAAWGGRLAAVSLLAYPLVIMPMLGWQPDVVDYVVVFMVAAFLWTGATQALTTAKLRSKMPGLHARGLARPAIGVPANLPLSEALRRAQEARAGSVVVITSSGEPVGIVSEAAVMSTPPERRPWLPVGDLARRVEDGLSLDIGLSGEPLLRAMNLTPATEYVILDTDGSVYGVLVTRDVDKAFRAA